MISMGFACDSSLKPINCSWDVNMGLVVYLTGDGSWMGDSFGLLNMGYLTFFVPVIRDANGIIGEIDVGYECCLDMSELLGIFVESRRNLGVDIVCMVQVALDGGTLGVVVARGSSKCVNIWS